MITYKLNASDERCCTNVARYDKDKRRGILLHWTRMYRASLDTGKKPPEVVAVFKKLADDAGKQLNPVDMLTTTQLESAACYGALIRRVQELVRQ